MILHIHQPFCLVTAMNDSVPWFHLMDLTAITIAAVIALSIYYFAPFQYRLPLPPGPKSSWLGKTSLPKTDQWKTYAEWKEIYGRSPLTYSHTHLNAASFNFRGRHLYLHLWQSYPHS